ncbi:MAG: penicillin-binding protein activator, partial [Pseudomonadota bacterium]
KAANLFARLHETSSAEIEKFYARQVLEELVSKKLTEQDLWSIYRSEKPDSILLGLAGERLADLALYRGNILKVKKIEEYTLSARKKHKISTKHEATTNPAIGLFVPMSGPYVEAGNQLISGATAAAGTFESNGETGDLVLLVRNSSNSPEKTAEELVAKKQVIALFGTLHPQSAHSVAKVAALHDMPFVSLARPSRDSNVVDSTTIQIVPENAQRARALAKYAWTKNNRKFAILAPESNFGREMALAFRQEVEEKKGEITAHISYPIENKSFVSQAKDLAKAPFQSLFIPDSAQNLALIAPALALADLWSSDSKKKRKKGRPIQLLATADGLHEDFVNSAGRYVQGGVFCPGFFPDENAPQTGSLLRLFRENRGRLPHLVEALSYDAVGVLRSAIQNGIKDRSYLMKTLRRTTFQGLTGRIRFDSQGVRADPPFLYQVRDVQIIQVAQ